MYAGGISLPQHVSSDERTLASLMSPKDDLIRRVRSSIRRMGLEFRRLISAPTSRLATDFRASRGRRGTFTGPVSHHFLQAKPTSTLFTLNLNPSHRAGESRKERTLSASPLRGGWRLIHQAESDSSQSIVSWPLQRPASRPDPGYVPFRFEIRLLYTHGSAQVGFSPFYILTEHDTISAHAPNDFFRCANIR